MLWFPSGPCFFVALCSTDSNNEFFKCKPCFFSHLKAWDPQPGFSGNDILEFPASPGSPPHCLRALGGIGVDSCEWTASPWPLHGDLLLSNRPHLGHTSYGAFLFMFCHAVFTTTVLTCYYSSRLPRPGALQEQCRCLSRLGLHPAPLTRAGWVAGCAYSRRVLPTGPHMNAWILDGSFGCSQRLPVSSSNCSLAELNAHLTA